MNLKENRGRQGRQVRGAFCEPGKPGQGLGLFSFPETEVIERFEMME